MEREITTAQNEWAKINIGEDSYYEYQEDLDDEETYFEGYLLIEDKVCIDYDGCYELPQLVKNLLTANGINCSEI